MRDSLCPLCKAKLKERRLQWCALWNPFPPFRCSACATLLAWNKWIYVASVLLLWGAVMVPLRLIAVVPREPQHTKQLEVLLGIQFSGLMTLLFGPVALYRLLPLGTHKIRDELNDV